MMAARKGSASRRSPIGPATLVGSPVDKEKSPDTRQDGVQPQAPNRGLGLLMRLGVAAVAIIWIGVGARWAASQAVPNTVRVPHQDQLAVFPKQLGPWKCDDEEQLDLKTMRFLGTELTINRRYSQSAERVVEMHAAVFTQAGFSLPHPPELCYSGTGWRVRSTRDARVILPDGTSGTVRIIRLEKDRANQRATVLYCYQLAGPFSADRDTVRTFFWKYRGQKSRPPLVKLMLHIPGGGEAVEDLALDFAQRALEKFAEMEKTW